MNAVKRTICLRRLSLAALALSVAWPAEVDPIFQTKNRRS